MAENKLKDFAKKISRMTPSHYLGIDEELYSSLQKKREEVSARALAEARKKTGMRAEDVGPPDLKGAEEQDARWRKSAQDSAASERETARKIREGTPIGGDGDLDGEARAQEWLKKNPEFKNYKFWREVYAQQRHIPEK
jgi:hypothetical protein